MAYRFELREQVASAFPRIAKEQLDRVLGDLKSTKDQSSAVHESRKSLKRLRALLRLARPGLGEATFKAENAGLRDIGAMFSADRDRFVLQGVAEKQGAAMGARYRKAFAAITGSLGAPTRVQKGNSKLALEKDVAARLSTARKSIGRLRFQPNSFELLQDGLKASYRKGRSRLREAYHAPNDEAFHDLRKSIQQHWRHMQVLQRAWPDLFAARLSAARRLSQILGDDHDLAVFVARVHTLPRAQLSPADRRAIERHCRGEQRKLRVMAHPLCQQLYAERAGQFAKRIAAIWQSAVRIAEMEEAPVRRPKPAAKKSQVRRGNSAQSASPRA